MQMPLDDLVKTIVLGGALHFILNLDQFSMKYSSQCMFGKGFQK